MRTYFHTAPLKYDGSQLSSLFAYREFGFRGDSIVFFEGSCAVKEHMVDIEDIVLQEFISSDKMLHCIVEVFKSPPSLIEARMFQLLVVENATKIIKSMAKQEYSKLIYCNGDDIFIGGERPQKMSISIATVSGVSQMIHFALNITDTGIPPEVTAGCLNGVGITDVESFAKVLGDKMSYVYSNDILQALDKVRAV